MIRKRRSRSTTFFLGVAFYITVAFWLALILTAKELVSRPDDGRHRHLSDAHLGWTILVICVLVMVATVDHWVKFLNVVFGGLFLGLSFAFSSGHLPNGMAFPRPISAGLMVLTVGCSVLAQSLAKRSLRPLDRATLIACVAAFFGGMLWDQPTWALIGPGTGFCMLLALWAYNRHVQPPDQTRGSGSGAQVNERLTTG